MDEVCPASARLAQPWHGAEYQKKIGQARPCLAYAALLPPFSLRVSASPRALVFAALVPRCRYGFAGSGATLPGAGGMAALGKSFSICC